MSTTINQPANNDDFQSDFCPKCGALVDLDCLV